MDYKKIGEFLKSLRKAKGLTQQDVADALYVTQKTVSRWETGEGIPDINILTTVASFYEITVDELLNGERKKPNQSSYTINLKENEKVKLLKNKFVKNSNSFGIASIAIMGFFFVLDLFIGLFLSETAGIILGLLGNSASLFIFLYGSKQIKQQIYDSDIDVSDEEKDKLRKSIHKANIIFIDVMAVLFILTRLLFTIYLMPVGSYGTSQPVFIVSIAFDVVLGLIYLIFRNDCVSKGSYGYKDIRRTLLVALGAMEIIGIICLFTASFYISDKWGNREYVTYYLSLLAFTSVGNPVGPKTIVFVLEVCIIGGIVWMLIKGCLKAQGILSLLALAVQPLSFIGIENGSYKFSGLMPELFGMIATLLAIVLFIIVIRKERKLKKATSENTEEMA